jgi:hypothetical protein
METKKGILVNILVTFLVTGLLIEGIFAFFPHHSGDALIAAIFCQLVIAFLADTIRREISWKRAVLWFLVSLPVGAAYVVCMWAFILPMVTAIFPQI